MKSGIGARLAFEKEKGYGEKYRKKTEWYCDCHLPV